MSSEPSSSSEEPKPDSSAAEGQAGDSAASEGEKPVRLTTKVEPRPLKARPSSASGPSPGKFKPKRSTMRLQDSGGEFDPLGSLEPDGDFLEPGQEQSEPSEVEPIQRSAQKKEELPKVKSEEVSSPQQPSRGMVACLLGYVGSLKWIEKLCWGAIILGVLGFGFVVFLPALFDFPKPTPILSSKDFPIKGAQVEVASAETYWREPRLDGPDADRVGTGVAFVPVIDMKLKGAGNVRIFFRDADGRSVGDPLALDLQGDQDFTAVCTQGLENSGAMAAYKADEIEPWSVELHEAPSGEVKVEDFALLFKMNIFPIQK